ncbi:MAG: hypothetical protein IIZ08_08440 [Clostridia bacterium]|nr:hypothetical protein [Clostridia bacterium]
MLNGTSRDKKPTRRGNREPCLHSPDPVVCFGAFRSLGFALLVWRCPTPRWWRCPQTPAREP